MGKTSAPLVFDIILCSGCSNHGVCNFTEFREGTKSTDAIKHVVCACDGSEEPFWTGALIEICKYFIFAIIKHYLL